jgi:hypothetical protein
VEKCFVKFLALRLPHNQNNQSNQRQNNATKNYCRFCEKDSHSEDKCFSLERVEHKLKAMKSRINEVQENTKHSPPNTTSSKN